MSDRLTKLLAEAAGEQVDEIERLRAHAARLEGEVERLKSDCPVCRCPISAHEDGCPVVDGEEWEKRALAAESRAARLEERLGVAEKILREVEWTEKADGDLCRFCPFCGGWEPVEVLGVKGHGHKPRCALLAALGEGEG